MLSSCLAKRRRSGPWTPPGPADTPARLSGTMWMDSFARTHPSHSWGGGVLSSALYLWRRTSPCPCHAVFSPVLNRCTCLVQLAAETFVHGPQNRYQAFSLCIVGLTALANPVNEVAPPAAVQSCLDFTQVSMSNTTQKFQAPCCGSTNPRNDHIQPSLQARRAVCGLVSFSAVLLPPPQGSSPPLFISLSSILFSNRL